MYFSKMEHNFIEFKKSNSKNKKYAAIIEHKFSKRKKTINFGDDRYEQYKDATGLGLYSHKDHLDKKRRAAYKLRHHKDIQDGEFSAGYFSMKFLW